MMKAIANFFRAWQHAQRATWEYRIRFSAEMHGWVIEKCENGDEKWTTLHERLVDKPYAQIPKVFDSFADASKFAADTGLDQAYQLVRYAPERRLSPNQRAILGESPEELAQALDRATSSTAGASFTNPRRLSTVGATHRAH